MNFTFLPENNDETDVENQAIYASLSRLTGVDRPALIFRTIAASPGALSWCWRRIHPLYERGLLQRAGWRIGPALELPDGLTISREALEFVGVEASAKEKVERALDAYNRVNPCNLIAIGVLGYALRAPGRSHRTFDTPEPQDGWTPPEPITPVTRMLQPEEISDSLRRLVTQISLDQSVAGQPVLVPSLYRHLAQVPGFLALASVLLRPMLVQGRLLALVNQVREEAMQESLMLHDQFALNGSDDPLPDQERIQALLERFSWKIPEMIVVGEILRRALP